MSPSFFPAWAYGGVPRCAYELCRALVQLGEHVEVWTTDALDAHRRTPEAHVVIDGMTIRRFANASNLLAYHAQLYVPRRLLRYASTHVTDFDLIHLHSHRHLLEAIVARAAYAARVPYVCTANGTAPAIERRVAVKHLVDALGFRTVLRRAAACVAVSNAEIAHYRAAGVDAARIRVIPNGIRLDEYRDLSPRGELRRALGLGVDDPLVVFVGKITPRKGVDVLLRALARLPATVHLVVAGNFMMPEGPVRHLVTELGLNGRVHFTGLLLDRAKLSAYVDADVVAYPSADEIFGLVPAEALMCGAPVVVCDDSGCGELVRAAGGGLLVRYGDVPALSAALATLLGDRVQREQYVTSGRQYVQEYVGWERIARQTQELYRHVLDESRSASVVAKLAM